MHSPGGRKRNPSPLDSLSIYRYRFIRQLFGTLTISPMDTRGLPFRKHSLNIIAAHKQNPSCSCIRLTQFSSNYSIYQNAPLAIPKLPCIRLETPGGFFKVYFIIWFSEDMKHFTQSAFVPYCKGKQWLILTECI